MFSVAEALDMHQNCPDFHLKGNPERGSGSPEGSSQEPCLPDVTKTQRLGRLWGQQPPVALLAGPGASERPRGRMGAPGPRGTLAHPTASGWVGTVQAGGDSASAGRAPPVRTGPGDAAGEGQPKSSMLPPPRRSLGSELG